MKLSEAVALIESLAKGVNPVSGKPMPANSAVHDPQVIRSLFTVIRELESLAKPATDTLSVREKPANAGQPWTHAEDSQLLGEFDAGLGIPKIAQAHQRSRGAITSRLVKLGRLESKTISKIKRDESSPKADGAWKSERPRAGKPWTASDDALLKQCVKLNLSTEEIAKRLERGVHAVEVRLFKIENDLSASLGSDESIPF